MSDAAAVSAEYQAAIARLIAKARAALGARSSPTPRRQKLSKLAKQLQALAEQIEADEWLSVDLGSAEIDAVQSLRALGRAAERGAAKLPDPRANPVLPMAASCYLHLQYDYGRGEPLLYDGAPQVLEFLGIVEAIVGETREPVTARNLLSAARMSFDPGDSHPWLIDFSRI